MPMPGGRACRFLIGCFETSYKSRQLAGVLQAAKHANNKGENTVKSRS